jgi:hypothetical protein
MYTIFFTINCVEQLTFFKAFVDQLKFEQTLIFCLKVKLLDIIFQYTYGRWFLIFDQLSRFWHLLKWCRVVVFLWVFFELLQFEQLNISQHIYKKKRDSEKWWLFFKDAIVLSEVTINVNVYFLKKTGFRKLCCFVTHLGYYFIFFIGKTSMGHL